MGVNLLMETVKFVRGLNKRPQDISWVGSKDGKFAVTWREFESIARRSWYHRGGKAGSRTSRAMGLNLLADIVTNEVAEGLVIVFRDASWMEFEPGDLGPGWRYYRTPRKQSKARKFSSVIGHTAFKREGPSMDIKDVAGHDDVEEVAYYVQQDWEEVKDG